MKKKYLIPFAVQFFIQLSISLSCTAAENLNSGALIENSSDTYTVYIVNNNLHTGIVLPVEKKSLEKITALKYFDRFSFADIGWGEEKFYQDPDDNFCMGARAVLLPNTSVIRIEGYSSFLNYSIEWSDYTVMLSLSDDQYIRLLNFIEKSFRKDNGNELLITSQKHKGAVIFFKSLYRYHLFNTCNTWIAEALKASGFDVSPSFIITAGQLYNEIKGHGKILKQLK